jgi:predicted dehydrogenase
VTTDTTPVRWGILATGAIAEKLAADVALVPGNELAAVGSRRLESARAFADRFGVARAHGSYEELAADPDVDVVYVATPHGRHLEDALLCLEHGKAVLCEKALTMDQPDARRLVETAREKKLFLAEAMWMRVHPLIRRVLELVESGALGEVRQLRADLGFVAGGKSRLWDPDLGASALLDVGIYPLTFANLFLGAPERIAADGVVADNGFDLSGGATLTYPSGAVATISWSQVAQSDSRASIAGTEGRIEVNAPMHHPTSATYTSNGEVETLTAPVTGYGYAHEVAEVADCLRRGDTESALLPLDATVDIMGQMDAMRAQIAAAAGAGTSR